LSKFETCPVFLLVVASIFVSCKRVVHCPDACLAEARNYHISRLLLLKKDTIILDLYSVFGHN
jgi:hypothetical protein